MTEVEIETDPRLIARLRKAAEHVMSPEEIREQRISFVYGSLGDNNHMTKEQVADMIRRHYVETPVS